jgi:hypothetical protein
MGAALWLTNLGQAGSEEGAPVGPGGRRDWMLLGIGRAIGLAWLYELIRARFS